jgi:Kef-type K+ transport system membrane component KefB
LIGVGTSRWMGFGNIEAAYLGFGLAASSTLVVLQSIARRQAMFEPFGRVVTGVLLLQDALLIAVIVVLSRLGGGRRLASAWAWRGAVARRGGLAGPEPCDSAAGQADQAG